MLLPERGSSETSKLTRLISFETALNNSLEKSSQSLEIIINFVTLIAICHAISQEDSILHFLFCYNLKHITFRMLN